MRTLARARRSCHQRRWAEECQLCLVLLFQKGFKSLWSILRLCEAQLTDDAAVVLRSLFNLLVVARWLGRERQQRPRWYMAWFGIVAGRFLQANPERRQTLPELQAMAADAEAFFHPDGPTPGKVPRQWHGSSIRRMAAEVGLETHYAVVYSGLSSIEHSDFFSYLTVLQPAPNQLTVKLWSNAMLADYLAFGLVYFAALFDEWNSEFHVIAELRQIVEDAERMLLVKPPIAPK